jgi:cytochrome P450
MARSDAAARPPGPHAAALYLELLRHRDPTATLDRLSRKYPRLARLRLGTTRVYLLTHPALITELLVTHGRATHKGRLQEKIRIVLGEGLLTSEGAHHARQRRLIQPALQRERLESYLPLMVAAAEQHCRQWRDGERVELSAQMSALTLTVVGQALFGSRLAEHRAELAGALATLLSRPGRHLLPGADLLLALPTPGNRRMLHAADRLDRLVWRLVEQRRAHPGDDLLSTLATLMPAQQARDEAMTLLLAGHETTATALSWAWWLLDRHPAVARWWREEVDGYTGEPDPDQLPRSRAVLAEAIRLYPPSWLLGRRLTRPVTLDGWHLPTGALCAASQWATHRDPRFWPDPVEFRPRRWLTDGPPERFDESAPGAPRGAYFPFGMGARACVGRAFAWAEGTLLLATLGRRWAPTIVAADRVVPLPSITLRPRHGLPAILRRRP